MRYLTFLVLSFGVTAAATTQVTLYQGGFAYVEEERSFVLQGGAEAVIEGLPATVIPGTLSWDGLDAIRWELVPQKIGLESLIGKEVLVSYAGRTARGVLTGIEGGLVLETQEGYLFIPHYESILSPEKPNFATFTNLRLYLASFPETEKVTLRYLARELSWEADYIGLYSQGTLSLRGIAILRNRCGIDFHGARVSLIAGEVFGPKEEAVVFRAAVDLAAPPAPQVSPVAAYHRYLLPGTVDIPQGETMVEYLPEIPIEASEIYRFVSGSVLFILKFTNTTGLPLPAGVVRVYGESAFLGEASLGHTPVGNEVELPLGVAFDLTGERTQTEYQRLAKDRYREGYRITIRSAKGGPVTVEVVEALRGEWRIVYSSLPYEVLDAHRVRFQLPVPPQGEAAVEYTVEYTH